MGNFPSDTRNRMNDSVKNRISLEENSERQLLRLTAASQVYAVGKRILGFQAALTILGGFASPIAVTRFPQLKVWAAFYAFIVALVDALLLERLQSDKRLIGARIQELFDCDLFQLRWRRLVAGEPPAPEVVREEGARYKRSHKDTSHLKDWYAPVVSRLSLQLGRLICQRTNTWWDSTLRRRYCASLKALLCVLAIFVFALAIYRGMTIDLFVLTVLAPLTPAFLWGVREIRKNSSAAEDMGKLQTHIDRTWQDTITGSLSDSALDAESVLIQNQIFYSRSKSPLVFNWLYFLLRGDKEKTMHEVATELVEQALGARGVV
jgi:predicted pore-forming effector associated with SMODS systems